MADRFKIGEGYVSVDTEDDTPKGLARIKAGVDRFIGDVEQKVRRGFASGFDSGADAAEARMAKFTREVTGELDRIEAKRTKINVDILDAAEKIVKLRKEAETATVDRRLKIDAEIASAMAEMKVLKREAEDLDGKKVELEAKLRNGPETELQIKKIDKASNDWISTSLSLVTTLGRVTGTVSGLLSLLGPVTNGIVGAVAATGEWLAAVSPLAALLPGLAASVTVLGVTVKAVLPDLGKAFTPVVDAAKDLQKELGKAASDGVAPLAAAFVKADFPAIEAGTRRIAEAVNSVVTSVLAWTATADGQRAVSQIMDAAASAAERLAPSITGLVKSFGDFIGRVGDPAIGALSRLLGDILDKTARWVDTLDSADIARAFDKAKAAAQGFADKLSAAKEVVQWLADHQEDITRISDALAGVGIVLGLATGGWVAAVAGAVTLILNHFEDVKKAATAVGKWLSGVWDTIANDPSVQLILGDLRDIAAAMGGGIVDAINILRQAWEDMRPALEDAWKALGPIIHEFLSNKQVQDGVKIMAEGFVLIAAGLLAITAAAASVSGLLAGITGIIVAWSAGAITDGIGALFGAVGTFLDGLGRDVMDTWDTMAGAVSDAWGAVVGFFESTPETFSGLWQAISQLTSETWDQIIAFLSGIPAQVGAFFLQIATEGPAVIGQMAGELVGSFTQLGLDIINAIVSLPGQAAAVFGQLRDQAVALAQQLVLDVISWFAQLPGRALSAISGLIGNVTSTFNGAKTQASTISSSLVSSAIQFLAELPGKAFSAISGLIAKVTQVFTDTHNNVVKEVTRLIDDVIKFIKELPGKAVAALAGIGSALVNAGSELIGGFIRGIQSKIPDLTGTLSSITSKLPDWKGPADRDATILEPAGRLVMAGFGRGIAEGTRAIERQLAGVTDAVAAIGARSAAANAVPAAGASYNFEPGSILLDVSKVKTLQDLIAMLEGIRSTSRQYGAVARSGA